MGCHRSLWNSLLQRLQTTTRQSRLHLPPCYPSQLLLCVATSIAGTQYGATQTQIKTAYLLTNGQRPKIFIYCMITKTHVLSTQAGTTPGLARTCRLYPVTFVTVAQGQFYQDSQDLDIAQLSSQVMLRFQFPASTRRDGISEKLTGLSLPSLPAA